jgi:cystathionine gamma-synthase
MSPLDLPACPPAAPSATTAVRAAIATDSAHGAVIPPLHLSSNFTFAGFDQKRTYDYTRSGNPTRDQLAEALAALEGGERGIVTSTGMSAVGLVLTLLQPGDTLIAAHDCYGGTQRLLRALGAKGHFTVRFVDLTTPDGVHAVAASSARLVWVETPSNPLLRITDLRAIGVAARAAGALVAVDNTFLTPALQRPLALGADIVVHSTTKYLNGHSDVVGGAVITADRALGDELAWWANATGITGAPFDAWLALRGLRTLQARLDHHLANTAQVVEALVAHPAVARVHYPGLASHAGHALACTQQHGFGAIVSADLVGGVDAARTVVESLRLFTFAESLGGVESLVAHPPTMTHASMDAAARAAAGIGAGLLRFSVGIEAGADLVADVVQALDQAPRALRASRAGVRV